MNKRKEFFKKDRKIYDAKLSIKTLLNHCGINFLYSLLGGLVIGTMIIGNLWLIGIVYYIYKRQEGKVIYRPSYTSKFGKKYVYPLPSTFGFVTGYLITEYIKTFF